MTFIKSIAPLAVEDFLTSGVLPSLTLAQGMLESGTGNSGLAVRGKNLFGIKGKPGALYWTSEYVGGQWVRVQAYFRHYDDWAGSIADHSALIHRGTRDNPRRYAWVIGERDYKKAAREIWRAGYATDPNYPAKLIAIIEAYNLDQYDREGFEVLERLEKLEQRVRLLEARVEKTEAPEWFRKEFPGLAEKVNEPMELLGWRAVAVAKRS